MATIAETTQKITEENLKETQDVADNTETLVNLAKEEKAERDKNKILQLEANREARGMKKLMQDLLSSIRSGFDSLKESLTNLLSMDESGGGIGLGLASLLAGIGLGLEVPGIFNTKLLNKAIDNFKLNLDGFKTKLKKFFNIADDIPKVPAKVSMVDDAVKLTTSFDEWKVKAKNFINIADDLPKIPAPPSFIDEAAGVKVKIVNYKSGARLVYTNMADSFIKNDQAIRLLAETADATADATKVTTEATGFIQKTKDGIMKGVTTISEGAAKVTTKLDEAAKAGDLVAKVTKFSLGMTTKVIGRTLSVAGNPVFDAIAMGKDIFDIGKAKWDDDVRTSVKKEDIGAVIGGFIGGAIGMVGGPAGVALGVGLGNMAGEFVGELMDDPEIVAAIHEVHKGLKDEKASITNDIASMKKQLEDKNLTKAQRDSINAQIAFKEAKIKSINSEIEEVKTLDADMKALEDVAVRADQAAAMRDKLEAELEKAEDDNDLQAQKFLKEQIEIQKQIFKDAEAEYQKKEEDLRKKAQDTTAELADASTNFFDRVATGSGFFADLFKSMGAEGLTGKGRAKFLKAEGQEDIDDLEKALERMNSRLESGLFVKDRKGNLSAVGKRQKTQLEQAIKTVTDKLEAKKLEVEGIGGKKWMEGEIARIDKEIQDEQADKTKVFSIYDEDKIKRLQEERAALQKQIQTKAKGGTVTGGRMFLVGEQGPEAFIPAGMGDLIPTRDTSNLLNNAAQLTAMSRENMRAGGGQPMIINNIDNSQKTSAVQNSNQTVSVPTSPHNGQSTLTALQMATQIG